MWALARRRASRLGASAGTEPWRFHEVAPHIGCAGNRRRGRGRVGHRRPREVWFGPAKFDKSVRPQDDLFRYVNGQWLAATELPADRAVYGTFVQLSDKAEADLNLLIEELAGDPNKKPGSTAQQVGDLFTSFTDEKSVDALGAAPLKPRLAKVDAIKNATELATVLGEMSMSGLPGPIGGYVEADAGDPTKVALYLSQGGTALPDRDYYLKDDAKFVEVRQKYQSTREGSRWRAVRMPRPMKTVLALETELARVQWTQVESCDAVKTYNKIPFATILATCRVSTGTRGRSRSITRLRVISQPSFFKISRRWCRRPRLETPKARWPVSDHVRSAVP